MSEIPRIQVGNINEIGVPNIYSWYVPHIYAPTVVAPGHPSVLQFIGRPIIDMPGCVEVHKEENRKTKFLPELADDDPKDIMTLCPDGFYPSYDAMNYEPEQLIITREAPPPDVVPPPEPPGTPETPETGDLGEEEVPCPGPNQPRIGTLGPNEKEKVSGYELQKDPVNPGKQICVILYTDIGPVEQYLPSAQVASTTAAIATVAGASALLAKPLADLLLRVFRPAIKTALTKANAILGRTPYRPTQSEIRTNEYRKKKGQAPMKFGQKKKPLKKAEQKKE
tara:strand:+ start:7888 stop:8730 length:843 start_codon:yes stop_codon:yes gene_type:complete